MKNDKRNGKKHIPPHDVVERLFCSSKATRSEDVQVEHPVCCGDSLVFDFHPILPCMRGLIVSQVGGSLRDVQELAGHTSLAMTQRYIEGDTEAKRKLVALI